MSFIPNCRAETGIFFLYAVKLEGVVCRADTVVFLIPCVFEEKSCSNIKYTGTTVKSLNILYICINIIVVHAFVVPA